jgi:exodeoxyribonuclease VIII
MNDLMIDIETLGSGPRSCIATLGAARFDIDTGNVLETFYRRIDIDDAMRYNVEMDAPTVLWWMEQSDEAREELLDEDRVSLADAVHDFEQFYTINDRLWAKSPQFDLVILKHSIRAVGGSVYWHFVNERDVRTLAGLFPDVAGLVAEPDVKHHALQDCYYQAAVVSTIHQHIKKAGLLSPA